jgi:hypothetical protein
MTLAELLERLPPAGIDNLAFPRRLLGAFRRKSITFCTGLTDETTGVYWFQSKTFTIDLRLPDGAGTGVLDRQGWVGDTLWDPPSGQLSWAIHRSYQPRNQWPEPAGLSFIGNCILEFAPSGAYVEDWRQQSTRGPLLGLRLTSLLDEATGLVHPVDGGLILAGEHTAFARSRLPLVDDALQAAGSLEQAMEDGIASEHEIASYEVSAAIGGPAVTHSTQPERRGEAIAAGDFAIADDGGVTLATTVAGAPCRLGFAVDVHLRDFAFDRETASTPEAQDWLERERGHLARHAVVAG